MLNLAALYSFGQKKNISGEYFNESGSRIIVITNDSIILKSPPFSLYERIPERVFAEATFKWVDKNLIEINSTPPYILINEGMLFEVSVNPTITDSIKLSFSFPNYNSCYYNNEIALKLLIFSDNDYNFIYSEDNKEFTVPAPKISDYILIYIYNPIYDYDEELDGAFYGFRYIPIVYTIEGNVNHISIEIPAIDDAFFMKYFIKGEYARVIDNKIYWKGEVFIKQE
jgi:hypothetical protein